MVGVVALRALEVSRWQERHRVGWDAADGRNEGRNALSGKRWPREIVSSTEHVKWTRERSRWCLTWLRRLRGSVSQLYVNGRRVSTFSERFLQVLRGCLHHQRRVQIEGCGADPDHHRTSAPIFFFLKKKTAVVIFHTNFMIS